MCRKDAADPPPGLAVLLPFEGLFISCPERWSPPRPHAGIELCPCRLDSARLVVEQVALAGAAVHKQLNDPLGFGPVVQPPLRSATGFTTPSRQQALCPKRCAIATPPSRRPGSRGTPAAGAGQGLDAGSDCAGSSIGMTETSSFLHLRVISVGDDSTPSIHEHELVAVQNQSAGVGHAVPALALSPKRRQLRCGRRAAKRQLVRCFDLYAWGRCSPRHAGREVLALPHDEVIG